LSDHVASVQHVLVYVLDGGVSARNRKRVERSVAGGMLSIQWIRADAAALANMPVFGHVSICTYYRLLIPELLPESVNYVLYLDVDILVTGDVSELWNLCNRTYSLLAVPQPGCMLDDCQNADALFGTIPGLGSRQYFNAGVLGLSLDRWRERGIASRVIEFLADHREYVRMWDQDGLNACLWDDWSELPYCWNTRVDLTDPDRVPKGTESVNGILHFASASKPWHYGAKHPTVDRYMEAVDRTDWRGWRPRCPFLRILMQRLRNKHIYGAMIRKLPGIGRLWIRHRAR
jgi:lipopolysaccharide biosynthesis glycosyltransferase